MLARIEKATGPKSRDSLYALRDVAWTYPNLDDWPEEERVLASLRERTQNLMGHASLDYAHILEQIANRAAHHRQFDLALTSMDNAIEVARSLPNGAQVLPGMLQSRQGILHRKQSPERSPFFGQGRSRWFDTNAPNRE
jgi:hypothetical protein